MDLVFAPNNGYLLIHPKGRKWCVLISVYMLRTLICVIIYSGGIYLTL